MKARMCEVASAFAAFVKETKRSCGGGGKKEREKEKLQKAVEHAKVAYRPVVKKQGHESSRIACVISNNPPPDKRRRK
jgi:hypothetical protein